MPKYALTGGPAHGNVVTSPAPLGRIIGVNLDEAMRPFDSNSPFAKARYDAIDGSPTEYDFVGCEIQNGLSVSVDFKDGPALGYPPVSGAWLTCHARTFVFADGTPAPVGFGLYTLKWAAAGIGYYLESIDRSPEAAREATEGWLEDAVLIAYGRFYDHPEEATAQYTFAPKDDHKQVPIALGHRKASVDDQLAEMILELWRLGLDTHVSCQERHPEMETEVGMAYVAFPAKRHAAAFHTLVRANGIEATLNEKPGILGHEAPDGVRHQIPFSMGRVVFAPELIGRITELLKVTPAVSG